MRFLTLLREKTVPEWEHCYYDYQMMKKLITIASKAFQIQTRMKQNSSQQSEQQNLRKEETYSKLKEMVEKTNELFFGYHLLNKKLVFQFIQLKLHELTERLNLYEKWESKVTERMDEFLVLILNLFYQTQLLNQMCQIHMEAYKKVQKKHIKAFTKFQLDSPMFQVVRLKRSTEQLASHSERLANLYHKHKQIQPQIAKKQLQQQMQSKSSLDGIYSYLFGFINGINLPLLVLAFILLGVNELSPSEVIKLENEEYMWWGVGYMTLYAWISAIAFKVYEKFRINYQLVFDFNDYTKKSYWPLGFSSVFSLIYLILFNIYALSITGVNQHIITSAQQDVYFPFAFGMIMILTLTFFNLIKKPFCVLLRILWDMLTPWRQVSFRSIWLTEQLITFIQPIAMISYTLCYTFSEDAPTCINEMGYYNTIAEVVAITMFGIRLIQTFFILFLEKKSCEVCQQGQLESSHHCHACKVKQVLCDTCTQNYKDFVRSIKVQVLLSVRCVVNIVIVIVSICTSMSEETIYLWWVLAPIVVVYNYIMDFVHDWDLSSLCGGRKRDTLIHPIIYNIGLFVYFLLRCAWVLAICPNVLFMFSPKIQYFVIVGLMELFRRLYWNILRVEKEHFINCYEFRVKKDNTKHEEEIKEEIKVHGLNNMGIDQLAKQRSDRQKQCVRNIIDAKLRKKTEIAQWEEQAIVELKIIQEDFFGKQ